MLKLCILGMSIALVGGVGVVSMSATHDQSENVVNINRENKKLVSYDDDNYKITITSEDALIEMENLQTYLLTTSSSDFSGSSATYSSQTCDFVSGAFNTGMLVFAHGSPSVSVWFNFNGTENTANNNKGYWWAGANGVHPSSDIVLTLNSTVYSDFKSALELDIPANMDSSNVMPSIADLFQQVTAAVNAFIGSLGDAFTQVTSLFWVTTGDNQGPTFLGMLILIGVGVGLVYFVYRVIKGLVHRI